MSAPSSIHLNKIVPEMCVRDVRKSIEFYSERMGFSPIHVVDDPPV
jgi:hypothetical protein